MDIEISGKTALVTGASKGLGLAIAKKLRDEGYKVIGTTRGPLANDPVKDHGIQYVRVDLADKAGMDRLIGKLSRIDVLINNAGISQIGPIEEVPMEKILEIFNINLFSQIYLIKGVLPLMRNQASGLIINITSFAGLIPVPFATIYASTKSAFETFTKGLRNEVRPFGIDVVSIVPGFFRTGIIQEKICSEKSVYFNRYETAKSIRDAGISNGDNPEIMGEKVIKIINRHRRKPCYFAGRGVAFTAFVTRFLSARFIEKQVVKKFRL